jgi:hypothetical protein
LVISGLVGSNTLRGALSGEGSVVEMRGLSVLGAHGKGSLLALCAGSCTLSVFIDCIGSVVCVEVVVALEGRWGAVTGVVVVVPESDVLVRDANVALIVSRSVVVVVLESDVLVCDVRSLRNYTLVNIRTLEFMKSKNSSSSCAMLMLPSS